MSEALPCKVLLIVSTSLVLSACSNGESASQGTEGSSQAQGGASFGAGGTQTGTSRPGDNANAGGAIDTVAERGSTRSGGASAASSTQGGAGGKSATSGAGKGGTSGALGGAGGTSESSPGGDMPLVYDKENTGADCPKPTMPAFSALASIKELPDPFKKADGTPITTKVEWRCRRAEIKAILEKWGVGEKPGKPSTFNASLSGNTINVTVGGGSASFKMTATIARPSGAPSGPIPAIVGVNGPTGSLPADIFSKRGIATEGSRCSGPNGRNRGEHRPLPMAHGVHA